MSTKIQEYAQAPGPHKKCASELVFALMKALPWNCTVTAISINGQTGVVTVEYEHEELEMTKEITQ